MPITSICKEEQMSPLIDKLTDQNMVVLISMTQQAAARYTDQSAHIATLVNSMVAAQSHMVSAGALNRVPSGLAQQALEHNAAAGQPFNAPKAA
jgi:hypothetical protein